MSSSPLSFPTQFIGWCYLILIETKFFFAHLTVRLYFESNKCRYLDQHESKLNARHNFTVSSFMAFLDVINKWIIKENPQLQNTPRVYEWFKKRLYLLRNVQVHLHKKFIITVQNILITSPVLFPNCYIATTKHLHSDFSSQSNRLKLSI